MHYFKGKKNLYLNLYLTFYIYIFFFAEGSCDSFEADVVLLIAPMIRVKYFRKNVFKNKFNLSLNGQKI